MSPQEIKKIQKNISEKISNKHLREAILELKDQAKKASAWQISDKIEQAEQNYRYMLQYLAQGSDDPQRGDVYAELVGDVYKALDLLIRHIETRETATLYYSSVRTDQMSSSGGLTESLSRFEKLADNLSLVNPIDTDKEKAKSLRSMVQSAQNKAFMAIWTSAHLNHEERAAISAAMDNPVISKGAKEQFVSALTLGLMQMYDRRKLDLLMTTYLHSEDVRISSAALVGMLLTLWRYSDRPLTRKERDTLMAVKEKETWSRDLRIAYIEMIRARDTENINRKMRDEVIPRMEQLRPNIIDKISADDIAALQENPEWQEMLEKSGVADQLKELTEIQMEGGDVMMSTFAHLKSYSFFNDLPNWFLPFDIAHTQVASQIKGLGAMGDILANAPFLCDSDKYSFALTLSHIPEEQRKMMLSQFNANADNIYEAMGAIDTSDSPEIRRRVLNTYMQNIYRFFKLNPRKNEFFDPFGESINLIRVPSLQDDFDDMEMLQTVAEFYFKLKFDEEALSVFSRLEALGVADAAMYQKIGYSYERMHKYTAAIENYQKAELLEPSSRWTMRRLATCYREIGDKASAQKYYKALADADPEDLRLAMLYGQSLLENCEYDEALLQFYKVEYLDEGSTRAWRPIAWTLFMTGDLSGAESYYKKIIKEGANASDLLNYGHVALAQKRLSEAIKLYAKALKAADGDIKWLEKIFDDDRQYLLKAGIDLEVLPMIADAVAYNN